MKNKKNKMKHLLINLKIIKIIFINIMIMKLFIIKKKKYSLIIKKKKFKLSNNIILLIYNNSIENIKKYHSFKKKNVVYSALLGNYDSLKDFKKQDEFDYILFTDNITNKKTNWTQIKIPEFVMNFNINIIKKQRFLKLHPHLFFKNYDVSIYIDSSFIIIGDLNEFLKRTLSPNFSIYLLEHPMRKDIYDEIMCVIKVKKEKRSIALKVRKRYQKLKFPKNNGLSENCLIIRRHNNKNCIYLMEKWWNEINHFSQRDQLSLNFIIWKEGIKIKYISKTFILEYFKITRHLKNYKYIFNKYK
jgi:hypothetical protein